MKSEKIMIEKPEEIKLTYLLEEIQELKEEIKRIKQKQIHSTDESLMELWDNEYDERWNDC